MTKIDIFSGFLGAGKTTLIKKLIAEAYSGEKLVLIENEFGEINIDGGFLKESGIEISEMSAGCICCSLVGDFNKALKEVVAQFHPDRILIEPSGVGKLSDVIVAVERTVDECPGELKLNSYVTVADASKVKVYMKNFGEFYNNQIETASTILLSRTDSIAQDKLDAAVALIREHNAVATIVTTPWDQLTGAQILEAMEGKASLAAELAALEQERLKLEEEEEDVEEEEHHHHHHHHDDEDDDDHEHHCCHHHHDDDDDDDHDHHCCHHHHDEDEDDDDHDHHCCCHHHHDEDDEGEEHHHHHHHADEVFTSWGVETSRKFTVENVKEALTGLDSGSYGIILRAKGIVPAEDGKWIHFDFVPGEENVRFGTADVTGKLCVIGSKLDEEGLACLFGV